MKNIILITLLLFSNSLFAQALTSVRPWLGVAIEKGSKGVKVKSVFPETPAANAGIMANDEITSISGIKIKTPEELIQEVMNKGVGYSVKVEFQREGRNESREMTLVIMPDMLDMIKKKLLNKPAPNFSAIDVRNPKKKLTLKKFLGKPIILEFWATWCPACVASSPRLLEFSKSNKDKIQILSFSSEKVDVIKKYLSKIDKISGKKNNHIIYLQSDDLQIIREYMASSIPMFILIDKSGNIVDLNLGAGSVLEAILSKAQTLL